MVHAGQMATSTCPNKTQIYSASLSLSLEWSQSGAFSCTALAALFGNSGPGGKASLCVCVFPDWLGLPSGTCHCSLACDTAGSPKLLPGQGPDPHSYHVQAVATLLPFGTHQGPVACGDLGSDKALHHGTWDPAFQASSMTQTTQISSAGS